MDAEVDTSKVSVVRGKPTCFPAVEVVSPESCSVQIPRPNHSDRISRPHFCL